MHASATRAASSSGFIQTDAVSRWPSARSSGDGSPVAGADPAAVTPTETSSGTTLRAVDRCT
jgi:hypothetical protein